MENKLISTDSIVKVIYQAINEHNKLNPEELKINKSLGTVLMGSQSELDSLGFITLLAQIESDINEMLEKDICIIDENLFEDDQEAYKDIRSLSEYIFSKIQ